MSLRQIAKMGGAQKTLERLPLNSRSTERNGKVRRLNLSVQFYNTGNLLLFPDHDGSILINHVKKVLG
jgi:hypothetical protein